VRLPLDGGQSLEAALGVMPGLVPGTHVFTVS
jgi:hypothetical protein